MSTIHAETAELAIDRLAIMVLQAGTPLAFMNSTGSEGTVIPDSSAWSE